MIIQILGVILAVIGFIIDIKPMFVIGGLICLFADIHGLLTRRLIPTIPIILYILGILITLSWEGILYGAVAGNIFDIIGTIFITIKNRKNDFPKMKYTNYAESKYSFDDDTFNDSNFNNKNSEYSNGIDYLKDVIDNKEGINNCMAKMNKILDDYESEKYEIKTEDNREVHYFQNGKRKFECPIDLDKKKNGNYVSYYNNGKIYSKGKYKDDLLTGTVTYYYQNGNKMMEGHYTNGLYNGEVKIYWDNGNLFSTSSFVNGVSKKGPIIVTEKYSDYFSHENSINKEREELNKPSAQIQKDDKIQKEYYDNCNLKMICAVDYFNRKNGEYKMFYEDGTTLYSKGNYKSDVLDGEIINYFKNGNVSMKASYKDGYQHGEAKLYYETGELQSIMYFENGEMIKEPKVFFRK